MRIGPVKSRIKITLRCLARLLPVCTCYKEMSLFVFICFPTTLIRRNTKNLRARARAGPEPYPARVKGGLLAVGKQINICYTVFYVT